MAEMAEMVASAVVGEMLSRISTVLIDQKPSERDDTERLEMAHIKIEAALHASDRWQITDVPMLRWRSKLKRAAQECDDTLRHRKQRALEDEEARRSSSFPRRVARAARSFNFMASFSTTTTGSGSNSVEVRRFERFADNTIEFLKLVEFGGRRYTFFNPLVGDLLSGKTLCYRALRGGRFYYLAVRPMSFADRGMEAMAGFVCKDSMEPARSFSLGLVMRLSESTDIFGVLLRCMQSTAAAPHFMAAAEDARREVIQLPSQDFSWVAYPPQGEEEHWSNVHSTVTQLFRPNPLCCNEHDDLLTCSSNSMSAHMYPEEVIVVYLQCRISSSDEQQHRRRWQNAATTTQHGKGRRRNTQNSAGSAPLKLELLFVPHYSPESVDHQPAAERYAYEVIDGNKQGIIHRNACLRDVDEELLPKAVHHLCQNSESRMYQVCLRSRHGSAHLCVEKTTTAAATEQQVPSDACPSTAAVKPVTSHVGNGNKRVEDEKKRKNPLAMKVVKAIRGLAGVRGKARMDISAFGFSAIELAALGHEQHSG